MTQYGWICPRCGKVHAPWVILCDCVAVQQHAPFIEPVPLTPVTPYPWWYAPGFTITCTGTSI